MDLSGFLIVSRVVGNVRPFKIYISSCLRVSDTQPRNASELNEDSKNSRAGHVIGGQHNCHQMSAGFVNHESECRFFGQGLAVNLLLLAENLKCSLTLWVEKSIVLQKPFRISTSWFVSR